VTPALKVSFKRVYSDLAGNATAGKWWPFWDSKIPEVPEDGARCVAYNLHLLSVYACT
jgi:hypothetical protein